MCKIGEIVVVGGVRRSAMISLSDLGDHAMQNAKSGQWWEGNAQRALANNSAVYTQKPDALSFIKEWTALIESKSGERGIYSRYGAQKSAPARRKADKIEGTNPCAI
jgi:ribonucleoside-diphosphate reductase alpha chain